MVEAVKLIEEGMTWNGKRVAVELWHATGRRSTSRGVKGTNTYSSSITNYTSGRIGYQSAPSRIQVGTG